MTRITRKREFCNKEQWRAAYNPEAERTQLPERFPESANPLEPSSYTTGWRRPSRYRYGSHATSLGEFRAQSHLIYPRHPANNIATARDWTYPTSLKTGVRVPLGLLPIAQPLQPPLTQARDQDYTDETFHPNPRTTIS
ncbi:hypothetical protein DL768_003321 [Monosporascus sp. mg162]|nr:hypothetical protein DL768_003321 [Monosporascus sp. mg162]